MMNQLIYDIGYINLETSDGIIMIFIRCCRILDECMKKELLEFIINEAKNNNIRIMSYSFGFDNDTLSIYFSATDEEFKQFITTLKLSS